MRFFFYRSIKFNPKIVTSFRSHGKWGDLIICLLPVSWCLNILSNSTTLLKLLEWQSESNFLSLRVRGKQWYWVYKFDFKSIIDIFFSNKISRKIGTYSFFNKDYIFNKSNYLNIFNSFFKNKNSLISNSSTGVTQYQGLSNRFTLKTNYLSLLNTKPNFFNFYCLRIGELKCVNLQTVNVELNTLFSNFGWIFFNELSLNRFARDLIFTHNPLKLIKCDNFLLFNNNGTNGVLKLVYQLNTIKPQNNNFYIVLKQKPISDWSKIDNSLSIFSDLHTTNFITNYSEGFLFNNFEKIQFNNNMRLLRLNKMLFLPTNVQINVITNSFDVIHSWFIPGLGLKMDCVPGRSTHHTLYIDIPGIYYGQCAEICGRFHHHMPIRVCALDFEHYMLWFNHFIIPSVIDFDLDKSNYKVFNNLLKTKFI